jgi:peptidoglycan/LPS O-acetylase OafA/YrhL
VRTSHSPWLAPMAAAIGWVSIAAFQLSGHDFRGSYEAPIDYFRESALMLAFAATAASVLVMSRAQDGRGRWASRAVAASATLVIIVIATGMASGEEPDWFFDVVGPALVTMAVSLLVLSIQSWNTGVAPRWALVMIVLTPLSIPAFWLGISLLPAVGWLGVAKGISRQTRVT